MNEEDREKPSDEELEDYLDKVWENWYSRRMCEKTHKPNYLKKEE
jgi:hypothetical protein